MSSAAPRGPHTDREAAITGAPDAEGLLVLDGDVDGYYEGPDQELDFWIVDDEFAEFSTEQLDEVDTLVFGRVTYGGMAAYWPTPAAKEQDPQLAARMNGLPKIVVSRTLEEGAALRRADCRASNAGARQ